jgi:glycosyltransferase involved in cell wall biosynthesis
MTADTPYFSIIIPSFNRAHLIGHTLQSVLNQTFTSFEVLVVDDGGTDGTKDVVEKLNNGRIRYYKKNNGERGAARNFGWQ